MKQAVIHVASPVTARARAAFPHINQPGPAMKFAMPGFCEECETNFRRFANRPASRLRSSDPLLLPFVRAKKTVSEKAYCHCAVQQAQMVAPGIFNGRAGRARSTH
jgi:hypothetical protein